MKKGVGKLIVGAIVLAGAGLVAPLVIIFAPLLTAESYLTLEAPGQGTFLVEEPVSLTLWYDHEAIYEGTTYQTGTVPSGWSFRLAGQSGDTAYELQTIQADLTKSGMHSESVAVGNFVDLEPGEYTLSIEGEGEPRIFSLQEAWFTGDFSKTFLYLGISGIFALLGVVLFITGLVQAVRKSPSAESA